jgi:hypothetical protein
MPEDRGLKSDVRGQMSDLRALAAGIRLPASVLCASPRLCAFALNVFGFCKTVTTHFTAQSKVCAGVWRNL